MSRAEPTRGMYGVSVGVQKLPIVLLVEVAFKVACCAPTSRSGVLIRLGTLYSMSCPPDDKPSLSSKRINRIVHQSGRHIRFAPPPPPRAPRLDALTIPPPIRPKASLPRRKNHRQGGREEGGGAGGGKRRGGRRQGGGGGHQAEGAVGGHLRGRRGARGGWAGAGRGLEEAHGGARAEATPGAAERREHRGVPVSQGRHERVSTKRRERVLQDHVLVVCTMFCVFRRVWSVLPRTALS